MAYSAGDFTESTFQDVRIRANEMFNDPVFHKQFKKPVQVFNNLTSAQRINITGEKLMRLNDGTWCQSVDAFFLQDCATTVTNDASAFADNSTDCSPDGAEIGTDESTYATAGLGVIRRKILHNTCRDEFDFQEKVAFAMESMKFALDMDAESRYISALLSNKTVTAPSTSIEDGAFDAVTDFRWEGLATSDIDTRLLAELQVVADNANYTQPAIISGSAFQISQIVAKATAGGGCCNDNSLLIDGMLPIYSNTKDLDTLTTDPSFFLVDMSALAYINATQYDIAPTSPHSDHIVFSVPSRRLTWFNGTSVVPVYYDVRIVRSCTGKLNQYQDVIEMRHSGAYVVAPASCSTEDGYIYQYSITA